MTIQLESFWLKTIKAYQHQLLAIRERVKDKIVVIEHISIELMIDDPLTKGMPLSKFKDHRDHMGLGLLV